MIRANQMFRLATLAAVVSQATVLSHVSTTTAQEQPAKPHDAPEIRPFVIAVESAVLDDLHQRLKRTRWPDQIKGTAWEYGVPVSYMDELVEYWQTKYDWRRHERELNKHTQFVTRIDGLDIHFVHVRSKVAGALPLVVVHGWPGS